MKRKLNEHNVPEVTDKESAQTFASLGLDARILKGIAKEKWTTPTPIQRLSIPLALEGKDILARSKTGSGKTAAYIIPIIQSILRWKSESNHVQSITALILVPTRELATQVTKAIKGLVSFCSHEIRVENLTRKEDEQVQRARLSDQPDIVVATPGRASYNVNTSSLGLEKLAYLVIDEADLVLSYGYEEDLQTISKSIPKGVQNFLMSATLHADVETLKGLFCREPVLLTLDEGEDRLSTSVSQYVVKCAEDEKFLLLYAIFMLKLVKGKKIIFVGDVERCYRVKLFLEQFGVRSCVLNSELPVNSRIHVVEEFNRGVYDIIIAADEHEVLGEEFQDHMGSEKALADDRDREVQNSSETDPLVSDEKGIEKNQRSTNPVHQNRNFNLPQKKIKRSKHDNNYGVARGIDFKNVACVLNFDLPTTSKSYTHRIGRTARAGNSGMALSFVVPSETYRKTKPTSIRIKTTQHDEDVLAKIERSQFKRGQEIQPYQFDMAKLEGFRYRLGDAMKAVTGEAIREARVRELRQELVKSERLKRHFEENPDDLQHLRHDGELRVTRTQQHLKHLPDYLLPLGGKGAVLKGSSTFVGFTRDPRTVNRIRRARLAKNARGKRTTQNQRKSPLQTFRAQRKG